MRAPASRALLASDDLAPRVHAPRATHMTMASADVTRVMGAKFTEGVYATGVRWHMARGTSRVPKFPGTLRAAMEPWDYDAGQNPLPIPMRVMTGFHIVDVAQGRLAPSWVTGFSFTFPIVDLPPSKMNNQLGTDVALAFLWEVDMQEKYPFRDGNHALITIGLNVLSLFGAK